MLEGRIVNLRPQELTDAATMQRWVNDTEVTATLGNRYMWSLAAEEEHLRQRAPKRPSFEEQLFAIKTKEGRHIGNLGLHEITAENRGCDLGIVIGEKDCWSQGYGTDAIVTALRFAFSELNLRRVELHAYADNERGIACYRKCGFVEEARSRQFAFRNGVWRVGVQMGVLRPEFEALHGLKLKEATA